jgi:hypothetical protein
MEGEPMAAEMPKTDADVAEKLELPFSPRTIRLLLAKKLQELRLQAGITPEQLKLMHLGVPSTTSRMEAGLVSVTPYKVKALCEVYGLTKVQTAEVVALATQALESSIFDDFSDVIPRPFSVYVQLESLATRVFAWEAELMPGLLQTPDYARAVFEAYHPPVDARGIERSLAIRQERQRIVFARPEVRLSFVLGEGVLARQVGGPDVAAQQLLHLRGLSASKQVEIRVHPWSAGAHAAMLGSFSLLEFDDPRLASVAYIESAAGAKNIDKDKMVAVHRERFELIYRQSVRLEEYAP